MMTLQQLGGLFINGLLLSFIIGLVLLIIVDLLIRAQVIGSTIKQNEWNRIALTLSSVAGTVLINLPLTRSVDRRNKRSSINRTQSKRIIRVAERELDYWETRKITGDSVLGKIKILEYFKAAGKSERGALDFYNARQPWSAAFISYVMQEAGVDDFKSSPSHSTYIRDGFQRSDGPFKTVPAYKFTPRRGDLIANPRQSGVSWNSNFRYKSHSDVIVSLGDDYGLGIGGNLDSSRGYGRVKKRRFKLENDKIVGTYPGVQAFHALLQLQ